MKLQQLYKVKKKKKNRRKEKKKKKKRHDTSPRYHVKDNNNVNDK